MFRIDAGGVTYAFGINNVKALQPVYWGGQVSNEVSPRDGNEISVTESVATNKQ